MSKDLKASGLSFLELEAVQPLGKSKAKNTNTDLVQKLSAQEITNLSPDTLRREHAAYIVRLSTRRTGMKLRHILKIANGTDSS